MFVQSYYFRIVKLHTSGFERRKSSNTRDKSKARKFFLSLEIFLQAETEFFFLTKTNLARSHLALLISVKSSARSFVTMFKARLPFFCAFQYLVAKFLAATVSGYPKESKNCAQNSLPKVCLWLMTLTNERRRFVGMLEKYFLLNFV